MPRSRKQAFLPGFEKLGIKAFGGSLLKGNPREQRPISTKNPMHLVLRSELARGPRSLLRPRHARRIETLVHETGKNVGVKVYRFANSGNHLHLVVLPRSREGFHAYVRAITGLIARIVLQVERGRPGKLRFWDSRPFTRILTWGREFTNAHWYLLKNTLEGMGVVDYRRRRPAPS